MDPGSHPPRCSALGVSLMRRAAEPTTPMCSSGTTSSSDSVNRTSVSCSPTQSHDMGFLLLPSCSQKLRFSHLSARCVGIMWSIVLLPICVPSPPSLSIRARVHLSLVRLDRGQYCRRVVGNPNASRHLKMANCEFMAVLSPVKNFNQTSFC